MPNVKELKDQAKAAGITGYSSMKKAELVKALEEAGAAPAEAPQGDGTPGIPTEPEKANLSPAEEKGLKLIERRGRPTRTASTKAGTPTEPERGGVTPKDLNAKGAFEPAKKPKPDGPPTITGADRESGVGVPTEPDRGGVNELERKLAGVK